MPKPITGDPDLYVNDGHLLVGLVFDRSAGIVATDAHRASLGTFKSRAAAINAIHEHRADIERRCAA